MRINREKFLSALHSVRPGLADRERTEQSSCFAFQKGAVLTFDEEVSCRAPSGLDKAFVGAVDSKPLLALLEKLPDDDLELAAEKGKFVIKGVGRKSWVTMEDEVLLAIDTVDQPGEWSPLPDDFDEAVRIVASCAGSDETRFALTCVHFSAKFIEATDGFQLCRHKVKLPVKEEFFIRADSLKSITSLGMVEISETESWVHFRNANKLVFSCRRFVESDFPDLAKFIKVEGVKTALPGGLGEAVIRAEVFSSENTDNDLVQLDLRPGKVRITGEGIKGGHQEIKAIAYKGEELSFKISPKLLVELCKRHQECEISTDRLKVDGGRYVYVACLIRDEDKADDSNGEADEE